MVESEDAEVVDSRTGSREISLLATLPFRGRVTGGRLGLLLSARSIAAGPGEYEELDVGVEVDA